MHEINVGETSVIAGAGLFGNFAAGQAMSIALRYVYEAVKSGQVDYAGIAESQGTYYNTVGA